MSYYYENRGARPPDPVLDLVRAAVERWRQADDDEARQELGMALKVLDLEARRRRAPIGPAPVRRRVVGCRADF